MMDINVELLKWAIDFLIKKSALLADESASGSGTKSENISNKELA